jgi:hypothetical protein
LRDADLFVEKKYVGKGKNVENFPQKTQKTIDK